MIFADTIKRFSLTIAMVIAVTATATTQSYAADNGIKITKSRFIPSNPGQLKLSFVRLPDIVPNQFVIRVALPMAVSGCDKFVMPPSQTKVEGNALNIYLGSPTLVNVANTQHPERDCSGSADQAFTDIVLNKWILNQNNIQKIIFIDEQYGLRKEFFANLNGSYIELSPASEHDAALPVFQTQNLTYNTNPMKYWFYPLNTVILYVPMADRDQDLSKEVAALAAKKGLKPMIKKLPGFTKPVTNPNYFYYVAATAEEAAYDQAKKLGTIQTTETAYGLIDDEIVTKELDVFMKAPGLYE